MGLLIRNDFYFPPLAPSGWKIIGLGWEMSGLEGGTGSSLPGDGESWDLRSKSGAKTFGNDASGLGSSKLNSHHSFPIKTWMLSCWGGRHGYFWGFWLIPTTRPGWSCPWLLSPPQIPAAHGSFYPNTNPEAGSNTTPASQKPSHHELFPSTRDFGSIPLSPPHSAVPVLGCSSRVLSQCWESGMEIPRLFQIHHQPRPGDSWLIPDPSAAQGCKPGLEIPGSSQIHRQPRAGNQDGDSQLIPNPSTTQHWRFPAHSQSIGSPGAGNHPPAPKVAVQGTPRAAGIISAEHPPGTRLQLRA